MIEAVKNVPLPTDTATCLDCGYALRALESRKCPECGRSFDPEVLTSMCVPREPATLGTLERRLLAPVHLPYRGTRTTLVVCAVIASWVPAPSPLPAFVVAVVWLVVAFPLFLRRAARRAVVVRYGLSREFLRVDNAGLWRMRRLFLIAFLVAVSHVPFFVNYTISRPFLDRAARHWLMEVPSNVNPPRGPSVHGLFLVTGTRASMRFVTFETPGGRIVYRLNERGDDVERAGIELWSEW